MSDEEVPEKYVKRNNDIPDIQGEIQGWGPLVRRRTACPQESEKR